MTGETADKPLYVKWVTADDGKIRWDRIILALVMTTATGYLASKSQRWGANPVAIPPRARFYHGLAAYAARQRNTWTRIEAFARDGYEIATMD